MIYHLSLLSFGDNLISLSLLAKLRDKSEITVVGTALTQRIAQFVPELDIPILVVSETVPSFYDVRKRGMFAAFEETLRFRKQLARLTGPEDGIIFEKSDLRRRLLLSSKHRRVWVPTRRGNVYEDRRDVLKAVFRNEIPLEMAHQLRQRPRTVTINPSSRVQEKALAPRVLASVVSYLRRLEIDVRLIDPDRHHAALRRHVSSYYTGTTLEEAVSLVERCDLYIGADSLLVHFAHYRGTPLLVLYNDTNLYFAPPGVEAQTNYLEFVSRMSEQELWTALDRVFQWP